MITEEEREKFIFPKEWNISRANLKNKNNKYNIEEDPAKSSEKNLNCQTNVKKDCSVKFSSNQEIHCEYSNKLYGSLWLLEKIACKIGVYDDLLTLFKNNKNRVNEVLTLSLFPYISKQNYSRFQKWQKIYKTLIDYSLSSSSISRLCQRISDDDRMNFIKLRLKRQPKENFVDCDSTTKSAWGRCLVDIRWGRNKDNTKLANTTETTVYSLTTNEPIYYRLFPGNSSDISTFRTILSDLQALDVKEIIFQVA